MRCHVTAELISDSGTIAPGTTSRVTLSLTLEPGWHVYWVYAGDAGEPPVVMWSLPQGVAVGPMQYPVPSRLPVGPLMDYGYQATAVFPFDLTASQNQARACKTHSACPVGCMQRDMESGEGVSGTQSPCGAEGNWRGQQADRRRREC